MLCRFKLCLAQALAALWQSCATLPVPEFPHFKAMAYCAPPVPACMEQCPKRGKEIQAASGC